MKKQLKADLAQMVDLITVSGGEQPAIQYLLPRLKACCDSVEVSPTGYVVARKKGKGLGPKVMVTAHMDEIGFGVKSITSDGFIKFEKIGDFSDKMIPARKVWVQTKAGRIPGVVGMKAGHLLSAEERARAQSAAASYIDIGAASKQEAMDWGVFVGAKIVLQSELMEMANPDIVSGKSLDDKVGCVIALNIMENLKPENFSGELIAAFSTLEEVTVAGAFPIYDTVRPDYAIVMDTVPCGDVPDIDTESELPVYMGRGPVMIVTQGVPEIVRFNTIHPAIRTVLEETAAESGVSLQSLALSEKAYITEESLTFMAGGGIPAATLAIPRRYSHTPIETMNLNDAVSTYNLLTGVIKKNGSWAISFI